MHICRLPTTYKVWRKHASVHTFTLQRCLIVFLRKIMPSSASPCNFSLVSKLNCLLFSYCRLSASIALSYCWLNKNKITAYGKSWWNRWNNDGNLMNMDLKCSSFWKSLAYIVLAIINPSVGPSVCPSVTVTLALCQWLMLQSCGLHWHDSSFLVVNFSAKSQGERRERGRRMREG